MLTLALTAFCASHGHSAAVGVLIAVWGIGSIVGSVAYSTRRWSTRPQQRAVILLTAFGTLLALTAAAPNLAILAAIMLLLGLPLSPWLGTLSTAVQQVIPASRTTEAFTYTFAVITTGIAAGNALGGLFIQQNHTSRALLAAAAAALADSVAGSIGLRRDHPGPAGSSRDDEAAASPLSRACGEPRFVLAVYGQTDGGPSVRAAPRVGLSVCEFDELKLRDAGLHERQAAQLLACRGGRVGVEHHEAAPSVGADQDVLHQARLCQLCCPLLLGPEQPGDVERSWVPGADRQ
jgi:hypothetical protein